MATLFGISTTFADVDINDYENMSAQCAGIRARVPETIAAYNMAQPQYKRMLKEYCKAHNMDISKVVK